jgi:murein DD-endopeptidase MepM/ murein hydrolase activator NlpD
MHCGIDLAVDIGMPVMATADGQVEFASRRGGYGKLVIVDHLNQFKTRYAHLSEIKVRKGDYVKRGDIIGLVGETGVVTGPHLHYEVRILDHDHPMKGLEHDPREFLPEGFDRVASEENDDPGLGSE